MSTTLPATALVELLEPALHDVPGPAYRRIADAIRLLVADGRLLHGTRLPSERALTEAIGVSRTTVTRAYEELRSLGYLTSRRGSGSVVTLPGEPQATAPDALEVGDSGWLDLTSTTPVAAPGVAEAYAAALAELPRYLAGAGYPRHGLVALRTALARRFEERGLATGPDDLTVVGGALGGLTILARALVKPGDRVLVESPTYGNALVGLRRAGARLVAVPPLGHPHAAGQLDAALSRTGAKLAYLVLDFHNPTSALVGEEGRAELAAVLRRHGTIAIVDESLCELALTDELATTMPRPLASFDARTITLGSAGKSHWGGLRLGWIRARRAALATIRASRVGTELGPPVMEQLVLEHALRSAPVIGSERRASLRASRDALVAALRGALPGWDVPVPEGGLSLWCALPEPRSSALATAAERYRARVVPGASFAVNGRGLERFVRLPFTLSDADVARAADVLARSYADAGGAPRTARRSRGDAWVV